MHLQSILPAPGVPGRQDLRCPGSAIAIRPALTPVERLLKDAGDLCLDQELPENVAAQVVPGLCRLAVEAAFTEAIRRRQFRAGKRHAAVEAEIDAAGTLTKRAAWPCSQTLRGVATSSAP